MKMYAVEFFKLNMGTQNYIYNNNDSKQYIKLGNNNVIIAQETDLETLKEFGGGIKSLKYVGELFENKDNNIDGLIVNITCNLVGQEDVEKTIEELQNKLSKLGVNFSI